MMNALQTSDQWQNYFHHPRGSRLAVFNLIFAIGQLGAILPFPIGAWIADHLGRRWGIVIGSIVSLIGCALQTAGITCKD
jgi:MFS family permease